MGLRQAAGLDEGSLAKQPVYALPGPTGLSHSCQEPIVQLLEQVAQLVLSEAPLEKLKVSLDLPLLTEECTLQSTVLEALAWSFAPDPEVPRGPAQVR